MSQDATSKTKSHKEPAFVDDLAAGWCGGALGILASNPLEVLKVRMQTAIPAAAVADTPRTSRVGAGSRPPNGTRAGLVFLWKTEGVRFLVAGAAAPILGLAFIDSAFFALYGRTMSFFRQDRQDPQSLYRVFQSGAIAGGVCALLQTPIEVVKCRAQVESQASSRALGSFGIARLILKEEGLKGFYHGGLTTTFRDTISSGIFFSGYIMFRRIFRGDAPFRSAPASPSVSYPHQPNGSSLETLAEQSTPIPELAPQESKPSSYTAEVLQILAAGGLAGSISAIIPYPLDIIKTRLQTVHSQPAPTMTSMARDIYSDGVRHYLYAYPQTYTHAFLQRVSRLKTTWHPGERSQFLESWTTRLLGLRSFFVGYRPTIASSFIGSAATITCVELVLAALSQWRE